MAIPAAIIGAIPYAIPTPVVVAIIVVTAVVSAIIMTMVPMTGAISLGSYRLKQFFTAWLRKNIPAAGGDQCRQNIPATICCRS